MDWVEIVPGMVLGLREGLEAFLIIGLLLWIGVRLLEGSSDNIGKLWESFASIAGLILLSTFIFWMMKHGKTISTDVQQQVADNVSKTGITTLAAVVVLREGVEISLFAFSSVNQQPYIIGIAIGVIASVVFAYLVFVALIRINLSSIFSITLGYLIPQAGYLFGYSVHEFLSALKGAGKIAGDSQIYIKAFNFADTILDHKSGALGVPLNIIIGWYSRPEWIQLVLHYGYVAGMFMLWRVTGKRRPER